jgi:hypothetical protein
VPRIELDAIDPNRLNALVQNAILEHVDKRAWDVEKAVEAEKRNGLRALADAWQPPPRQRHHTRGVGPNYFMQHRCMCLSAFTWRTGSSPALPLIVHTGSQEAGDCAGNVSQHIPSSGTFDSSVMS